MNVKPRILSPSIRSGVPPPRKLHMIFDRDDLLFNTLGAAMGYGLTLSSVDSLPDSEDAPVRFPPQTTRCRGIVGEGEGLLNRTLPRCSKTVQYRPLPDRESSNESSVLVHSLLAGGLKLVRSLCYSPLGTHLKRPARENP